MLKIFLPLLLICSACTSQAGAPAPASAPASASASASAQPAPSPAAAAGTTLAQIRTLIGKAACTSNAQCRSIGIGARPCGGPEGFLVYADSSDEGQLQALLARYKQERMEANTASGRISDCRAMVDPGAVCTAGACQPAPLGNIPR